MLISLISQIDQLAHQYPMYMLGMAWFAAAMLNAIPPPGEKSGLFYAWLFNLGQVAGANLSRFQKSKDSKDSKESK